MVFSGESGGGMLGMFDGDNCVFGFWTFFECDGEAVDDGVD